MVTFQGCVSDERLHFSWGKTYCQPNVDEEKGADEAVSLVHIRGIARSLRPCQRRRDQEWLAEREADETNAGKYNHEQGLLERSDDCQQQGIVALLGYFNQLMLAGASTVVDGEGRDEPWLHADSTERCRYREPRCLSRTNRSSIANVFE